MSALSTYIPPFFVGGAWVFSPERRERGREGERERSRRRGKRGNNPLPSRDATGEETKKRRKEKLTSQYIFPPSVLPLPKGESLLPKVRIKDSAQRRSYSRHVREDLKRHFSAAGKKRVKYN